MSDGRLLLDAWPHPLTSEGRHEIVAAAGMTLEAATGHIIPPGVSAVASVNGALVARSEWSSVVLQETDVVQLRATVEGGGGGGGSNPIAVVLSIAVLIAAPYAAAAILGTTAGAITAGAAGIGASLLSAGIAVGGILVVNSLFPPRLPNINTGGVRGAEQPTPLYSLSGGANRARLYEPLQMLLGQHRMFPDLASLEYTEYGDDGDQYLNQIFDFGIGDLVVDEIRIGKTLLSNYDSVDTELQPASGRISLVKGNVDTLQGGNFESSASNGRTNGTPYITRTTAGDTTELAFDLVSQHFLANDSGELEGRPVPFSIEWREVGTGPWTSRLVSITTPSGGEARNPVRRTEKVEGLDPAAYEVRCKVTAIYNDDDDLTRITWNNSIAAFRALQDEEANFVGRNPLAVRIKATGQLYGRLETVNALVSARIPDWDGSTWNTVRATSNPASILRWWFRGYYVQGTLRAGYGMPATLIDDASLALFHAHCETEGLECNIVILDDRHEDEIAQLIAQCGWGRVDFSSGKYGAIYENSAQPVSAVVTPANIIAGSLNISYDNENLADEVIGTYLDKDSDYQENTLRRPVPQPTITTEFPVTIPLEGVTDGEQAAKEINRAAAAQFYHQRIITWDMTEEGFLGIDAGDVCAMSNGLLGEGQGSRLVAISTNRVTLTLPFDVEEASGDCWIWQPDGAVHATTFTRQTNMTQVALGAALPALDSDLEGGIFADTPTDYRISLFPSSAALKHVRITSIEPTGPHRYRFTARDEVSAYYAARVADLTHPLIGLGENAERPAAELSYSESVIGERVLSWVPGVGQINGYHLRYGAAGSVFTAMTDLHDGLLSGPPWRSLELPDAGTWRFGLATVFQDSGRSDPIYVDATVGLPARFTRYVEVEIYRVVAIGDDPPDRPTGGEGSFNFETKTLTPPENWVGPEFPTFTDAQVVYACTATADTAGGVIWTPDDDDWIGPFIVGDANDLDLIYARFTNAPAAPPDPSPGVPTGWYTNIADVPAGSGFIYVAIGHRRRGETNYTWQLPSQLEAQVARITTGADFPDNPNFGDLHVGTDGTLYRWVDSGDGTGEWDNTGVDLTGDPGTTTTVGPTRPDDPKDGDIHIASSGVVFRWDASANSGAGAWINTGVSLKGDDGADGDRGSLIDTGTGLPTDNANRDIGDIFILDDGSVYRWQLTDPNDVSSGAWVDTGTNIAGDDGEDGEDGEEGFGTEYIFTAAATADPIISGALPNIAGGNTLPTNNAGRNAGDIFVLNATGLVYRWSGTAWANTNRNLLA